MKALLMAASAALALGACTTTMDAEPAASASATALSPAAMDYMRMAASGDMFEIESSRLALQMSQNPAMRQFAQMMIDDHTRMSQEMMATARTLGVTPDMMPMQMAPHHMQMLDQLRAAPAGNFDMAYHQAQLAAHQESLNLHGSYAANGDNEALRALAARATPAVRMHLEHLQRHGMHAAPATAPASPAVRAGERG